MSHHIDPDTRIHIEIDHIPCEVAPETTILSAAAGLGIQIPTLCYMKELAPDGSCRMCVVEVDGGRKKGLVTACSEHCTEGMVISTRSEKVIEARRFVLDLLMSNHRSTASPALRTAPASFRITVWNTAWSIPAMTVESG